MNAVMQLEIRTIGRAFDQHLKRYGEGSRAWDIPHHINLWRTSECAFRDESFSKFEVVYEKLRRRWQVFRGSGTHWSSEQVFDTLHNCGSKFQSLRLRDMDDDEIPELWGLLDKLKDLKLNKSGPSVVAISKFLHFWNPRLFMIVDHGVIWSWVLHHTWIWNQISDIRKQLDEKLFGDQVERTDNACDPASYLAILLWAGDLIRSNPSIMDRFRQYLDQVKGDEEVTEEMYQYEGVAVEWLLLGLVELHPPGVRLQE